VFCLHWRFVEIIFRSKYPSSSFFFLTILIFPRREQESVNFQVVFHLAVCCIRGIYSPREDTQRRRRGHKTGGFAPSGSRGQQQRKEQLADFLQQVGGAGVRAASLNARWYTSKTFGGFSTFSMIKIYFSCDIQYHGRSISRESREKRANTSKIRGQEQLDVAGLMNLLPLFHSTVLGLSVFSVQVKKFGPQKRGMVVFFFFSVSDRKREIWGLVCVCVREHCKSYRRHAVLGQRLPQVESVNQNQR